MKIEKVIEKLFATHGETSSLSEVIRQMGVQKVLLGLSNYCMGRSDDCRHLRGKEGEKVWRKRAKTIHSIMEDIKAETKPES